MPSSPKRAEHNALQPGNPSKWFEMACCTRFLPRVARPAVSIPMTVSSGTTSSLLLLENQLHCSKRSALTDASMAQHCNGFNPTSKRTLSLWWGYVSSKIHRCMLWILSSQNLRPAKHNSPALKPWFWAMVTLAQALR